MSQHHRTASWKVALRVIKPRIAAALPLPCVECSRMVEHGSTFDMAHIVSVEAGHRMGWTEAMLNDPSNLGPAHPPCNRSAGGKVGRAKQIATQKKNRRLPAW